MRREPERQNPENPFARPQQAWIGRGLITFFILCPGSDALFPTEGIWIAGGKLAMLAGGLLFWYSLARAIDSERGSGLGRRKSWTEGGYGILAGLLVAAALIVGALRGFHPTSSLLLILGFLIIAYSLESARAARATQIELLEARGQVLRSKLAPHFIFNTLNTLHAQIESDPPGAQATTERLAALFRQVLEASDEPTIPLRDELRFVEAYLGIERARLGSRLEVAFDIPEELEASPVPPLSLQVLVENAVKHGLAPLERGGEIRVGARRQGADLVLEVSDPGPGLGAASPAGTGTALETLRARLARPEDLTLSREDGRTVARFRWRAA